jgi:fatty acid desaturase
VPDYYRIQHVYVHHVEENGPADTQSTMAYDRTSFFDFSRHAFWQGLELVSGFSVMPYLRRRKKERQLREFKRGLAIWYTFMLAVAIINPLAALLIYVSRFLGGNILTLVAFFQHGVIDAHDVHAVHGNTLDYAGPEHGSLGDDYHVEHHLKPARHWSRYHEDFQRESGTDGGHRALVIEKELFTPIAFVAALWRRDFSSVARYARIRSASGDAAKVEELARERTRPIGEVERTGWSSRIDRATGGIMAWMMETSFGSCGLSRVPAHAHHH